MENSITKHLFIELYGLPGCGKSTLSHIVAERLRKEGHLVEEPSYDIDHQHPLPKRVKKFAVGGIWLVFHHRQYRHIWEIVKNNGYKGVTAFTMTVNVIQKMRIYNDRKSAEIIFLDQGLIQACVSLSTNGVMKAKENYERLLVMMPNATTALRIYIDVDEQTAIDRMSKRATNDSRVEKMKDENSKLEMLKHFREEIASIREIARGEEHVIVSTNNLTKDTENVYIAITKKLGK